MGDEQLLGKYARLRRELDDAYAASSWAVDRIDRIALELVQTERELGSRHLELDSNSSRSAQFN